jgi:hypothetical protein
LAPYFAKTDPVGWKGIVQILPGIPISNSLNKFFLMPSKGQLLNEALYYLQ